MLGHARFVRGQISQSMAVRPDSQSAASLGQHNCMSTSCIASDEQAHDQERETRRPGRDLARRPLNLLPAGGSDCATAHWGRRRPLAGPVVAPISSRSARTRSSPGSQARRCRRDAHWCQTRIWDNASSQRSSFLFPRSWPVEPEFHLLNLHPKAHHGLLMRL
jgi:hypothetical protein